MALIHGVHTFGSPMAIMELIIFGSVMALIHGVHTLGSAMETMELIIFGSVMALIQGVHTLGSAILIIGSIIFGFVIAVIQSPMDLVQPSIGGIWISLAAKAAGACSAIASATAVRLLRMLIWIFPPKKQCARRTPSRTKRNAAKRTPVRGVARSAGMAM